MVKVGDIVMTKDKRNRGYTLAVVTKVNTFMSANENNEKLSDIEILFPDGTFSRRTGISFEETGKHIDMQSVLDSIR